MGNVAALRRTSEQQLDHIRQLEDRERSLDSEVVSMRYRDQGGPKRVCVCDMHILILHLLD